MAGTVPLSDRNRKALRDLMYYETEQIRQEITWKTLGPPYGRAPPPKLPALKQLRSLAPSVRSSSIRKEPYHRSAISELRLQPFVSEELDAPLYSPRGERYSSLSTYPELLSPTVPKSPTIPFSVVLEESDSPENPFERPHGKHYFFPLEMFMDWSELPQFPVTGFVRQGASSDFDTWRPCLILSHDEQTRKFHVQIGDLKRSVVRQHLRFTSESVEQFNAFIDQAHRLRKSHEGFVRYFARFEIALAQAALQISPSFLESQAHIFRKMALKLTTEVTAQVKGELWDLYSRSVLKFVFDTQYFAPRAELMICPWKVDLGRQERWWNLIRSTALKEHPYQRSKHRVEDRFMKKGSPLHLTRLVMYQHITKLRWSDFYGCLKDFRSLKTQVSFIELKKEFRKRFAKATLAIDTMIKQLSDQVYKVLETSPNLIYEVDTLMLEAENALESNLQYAVHESVQRLIATFEEYYPIIPLAGDIKGRLKQIPSEIMGRHYNNWSSGKVKGVNEIQSIAIVKEMIGVLYEDLIAGRLHHYMFQGPPAPLLCISIESHSTRDRLQQGKLPDYFSLGDLKWEPGIRRAKLSKLKPSSRCVLSDSVKVGRVIRNVLLLTDECMDCDAENFSTARMLLDEAVFGWVSAGKDTKTVDLYPAISDIDIALQKLLKAPLKNVLRIKKFSLRPTEQNRIKVRNATAEIRMALNEHIADVFQYSMYGPVALLALLREFDYLFTGRLSDLFHLIVQAHIEDHSGLISELRIVSKQKELIQTLLPDTLQFGFFIVRLTNFKKEAKYNTEMLCEALISELTNEHFAILTDVTQEFTSLLSRLSQIPQTVEDMDEMNQFLEAKEDEVVMTAIKKELEKVRTIEEGLEEFQRDINPLQQEMTWKTKSWEKDLQREKQRLLRRIQKLTPAFQESVQRQVNSLKEAIVQMKADMAEFVTYNDLQNSDQYACQASEVLQRLQQLKDEAQVTNSREKILQLKLSDFQELGSMEDQFVSFHVFWNYASEWSAAYLGWMEKPLALIDPEVVQARFSKGLRLIEKMKTEMSNNVNVMRAVQEQEEMLRSFEHTIPLIYNLRQDSLRDRHWRKIWELLGKSTSDRTDNERKTQQTLRELLTRGIIKRSKDVEAIAVESKNEFEIEKIWTGIDKELHIPVVQLIPHPKHSEIQIIAELESFKDKIHEYLTTINYLTKANRHIDPFREQLKSLELMIATQQAVVEDLHEFQELICELYPLFKIPELSGQLHRTAERMSELVNYYIQQLAHIEAVSDMQNSTFTVRSDAKFTYPEASMELKKLREDVRLRISEKQEMCSRLYFLSEQQILELLSAVNSQEPYDFSLLFPGVEDLIIEERSITCFLRFSMQTRLKPIGLTQGTQIRSVEEWIPDLEKSLKEQHSLNIKTALKTIDKCGLQWDLDPDHEVAILAYLVWFYSRLQGIITVEKEGYRKELEEFGHDLHTVLDTGIQIMKPKPGRTNDAFSIELFSLVETPVLIDTRPQNELYSSLLLNHIEYLHRIKEDPSSDKGMYWKSALKLRDSQETGLMLDCFDYTLQCGYEMHSLDFIQSVVFTPLTERHSLHVFLSLKHSLGCIFTGDSGYDKTETVKYLALVAGKVFQPMSLTAETPFDRVVKLLIGCATGGHWGCYEEIHTLASIHLTTLAKYCQIVQSSVSVSPPRVTIDAYQLKPKLGFALFCTSKPTNFTPSMYDAFRVLALPQPDLALTATILLQINGVPSAKKYGKLIANAMKLLDQPVLSLTSGTSLHLHLKANTRTLFRVIKSFVAMDKEQFMDDKVYLINNAFRKIYGIGLTNCDMKILDECLASVFQSLHNDKLSRLGVRGPTAELIAKLAAKENVAGLEVLQRRCEQLFRLIKVAEWPWVFVVGAAQCGKSTTISLASKVIQSLTNTSFNVHHLGAILTPQSLNDLYEHLESVASPWLTPSFAGSYCSTQLGAQPVKYSNKDWIHIDGRHIPYSSDVIHALVRSYPYSQLKLLIECESLEFADPSVITEAGVLHLDKSAVSVQAYYNTVLNRICAEDTEALQPSINHLYEVLLLPCLKYMETNALTATVDSIFLVEMFGKLLSPFLTLLRKKAMQEASMKAIPLISTGSSLVMLKKTVVHSKLSRQDSHKLTEIETNSDGKIDVLKGIARVRRVPRVKQHMAVEAIFLISLVNSFANFLINTDAFSNMILELIKTQEEDFAGYLLQEYKRLGANSILEMTFSVKEMAWNLILSLFSIRPIAKKASMNAHQPEKSLSYLENIVCRYQSDARRDDLVTIPTVSTQRLSYWVEFCYRNKVNVAVYGPHQSGKSVVTLAVGKELLGLSFSGLIPLNVTSGMNAKIVQELIENSMESRKKKDFGGVGGAQFYAVLDDMNLDASFEIYDLFRFWSENCGWYSDGFTRISDLTVAMVHSYIEGKSRPLYTRAMRHFFMIHKSAYTESELTSIFKQHIDAGPWEENTDGMLSVAEEAVRSLVRLYLDLSRQQSKTEQMWCQLAISNFCQGLRFVAQVDLEDDIDIPQFLKLWTFMMSRFFMDQFGSSESLISHMIQDSLHGLVEKFTDAEVETEHVLTSGMLIPVEEQLREVGGGTFTEFEPLTEDSIENLVTTFSESRMHASITHPNRLKHLHSLLFDVESRLSAYIYFYLNTIFDVKSSCPSVVIRTKSSPGLVKALLYMAADTMNVKVYEFNAEEKEESFFGALTESFSSITSNHLTQDTRYKMKSIMNETMMQDKRIMLILTLHDYSLASSVTRRYMEMALDIVTGVKLRLSWFTQSYKSFVEEYRKDYASKEEKLTQLYNDEVLQLILNRMRANVTLFFVLSSSEDGWGRSPLHPVGILEQFKHEYRSLFNKSRVVDFDLLQAPAAVVDLIKANEGLVEDWKLTSNTELLRECGTKIESLGEGIHCDEYVYECVVHCSKALMQAIAQRRDEHKSLLAQAIAQVHSLQMHIRNTDAHLAALQTSLSQVEHRLPKYQSKLTRVNEDLQAGLAVPYEEQFFAALESQRVTLATEIDTARTAWEAAVDSAVLPTEEIADMDKLVSNPTAIRLLHLLHSLVFTGRDQPEKSELAFKKFISQLGKKWKETSKRLRHTQADALPDLAASLALCEIPTQSRVLKPLRGVYDLITAAVNYKETFGVHVQVGKKLEEETETVYAQADAIRTKLKEDNSAQITKLQHKVAHLESEAASLRSQISFLIDKKADLLDLAQNLLTVKETWTNALATYDEDEESAVGESILAGFYIIVGLRHPAGPRKSIWKAISRVMDKHGYDCQDVESLTPRLLPDHSRFSYDLVKYELAKSDFFTETAAFLLLILELKMPFPLIFDPFDVAFKYLVKLEEGNGVLIGRVTSDPEFERRFKECITEGKPVICQNPSSSLLQAVFPAVIWRAHSFLYSLGSLKSDSLHVQISMKLYPVHPNFRLYICHSEPVMESVKKQMTEVNFDATDKESWEGVLMVPLLKTLDEEQYQTYVEGDMQLVHSRLMQRDMEKSFLDSILHCDPASILTSVTLEEQLNVACHKLFFTLSKDLRRVSALIRYSTRRSSLTSLDDEEISGTKNKLEVILTELYDLKRVCESLEPVLEDYAVSGKDLYLTTLRAMSEHIRTLGLPLQGQWEILGESLGYNVFIRLSQSMSLEKRTIFSCFFALFKSYKRQQLPDTEFFQVLEDIIRLDTAKQDLEADLKYLRARYPSLFPSFFSPGSASFKLFLERELFSDAKLPDNFPSICKFLLYAYIRADLLPLYATWALREVLGLRYGHIPEIEVDLYSPEIARTPLVLFYSGRPPLDLLRNAAQGRKVALLTTQPSMTSVVRTGKIELKGVNRLSDSIKTYVNENYGNSKWLVIQNLHLITGLAAEVTTKFLLLKCAETGNDSFRLILLFAGRPADYPEWEQLIRNSQRLVVTEPQTVRELMLQWHQTKDADFYTLHTEQHMRQFWANCLLENVKEKETRKKEIVRKKPLIRQETAQNMVIQEGFLINPRTNFNVSLLCCIISLRKKYSSDLSMFWDQRDAQTISKEFLECLPSGAAPDKVLTPASLSLFSSLMLLEAGHFPTAALVSLTQQVLGEERMSLLVKSKEGVTRVNTLEYPLYTAERSEPHNTQSLLNRYPVEDHLTLTGLSQGLVVEQRRKYVPSLLSTVAALPLTISDSSFYINTAHRLSLQGDKERMTTHLQTVLSELLQALPEPTFQSLSSTTSHQNYPIKRQRTWFGKDKSPGRKGDKDQDLRNSVLDNPPSLLETLQIIKNAENRRRFNFLKTVRKPLTEMLLYLSYSRSLLSPEDMFNLAEIARNRVPERWLALSPFHCQHITELSVWKTKIMRCFQSELDGPVVDLSVLFAPDLALSTLLRVAAVAFSKKAEETRRRNRRGSDIDYQFSDFSPVRVNDEVKKTRSDQMGFEVSTEATADPDLYQVQVTGLTLTTVRINSDSGLLEDTEKPVAIPMVLLTPIQLPTGIRNSPMYPQGLKLVWGLRSELPWDLVAQVNSRMHEVPAYPKAGASDPPESVLVYCPVRFASSPAWLLASSREGQGYWSRRGAYIDLL